MAVNHGTSSMQIRVTGAFIRPIKSPIKPSSVREDGLLPYTHPCVAQPPTEDKSSTRIPPRGCREFSLPVSYPETQRNRSTYCLELILAPSLPSFFVRGNFHPYSGQFSSYSPLSPFFFPLSFSKSFGLFSVEACTREKREGGFSWRPGDEWWREFGKRGQVRPGLINELDRIACQEIRLEEG